MRTADPFLQMKKEEPDRYLRLEHWLQKGAAIDPRDLYPAGSSKEKRRAEIANMLIPEVRVCVASVGVPRREGLWGGRRVTWRGAAVYCMGPCCMYALARAYWQFHRAKDTLRVYVSSHERALIFPSRFPSRGPSRRMTPPFSNHVFSFFGARMLRSCY